MSISDDLKKLSNDDLAARIVGLREPTQMSLLSGWEWQRRQIEAQRIHEQELLAGQIKWMKISAIVGAIGVLVGALISATATLMTK